MKKRWIGLYVENETGVLAKISGLFSGKLYNMDSLTVGRTEDETVSRMTIGLTSDDKTFEQIKKQLNRSIEVIKVVDYTEIPVYIKELMLIKIHRCTEYERLQIEEILRRYDVKIVDRDRVCSSLLLDCLLTESQNNEVIEFLTKILDGRLEIVRGGSVAIEFGN